MGRLFALLPGIVGFVPMAHAQDAAPVDTNRVSLGQIIVIVPRTEGIAVDSSTLSSEVILCIWSRCT